MVELHILCSINKNYLVLNEKYVNFEHIIHISLLKNLWMGWAQLGKGP